MKAKIRGTPGVSMVFTLIVMMVVSIVCASVLKVTSTAPVAAYSQQAYEQSYLSATSAAKLLQDAFTTNHATAIELLSALQGTSYPLSKAFTLQITKNSETQPLNALTVTVTLAQANDTSPVTVSIAGDNASAGYPVNLKFGVYTVIWQDYAGGELARRIYPNGYPEDSVTPPESVTSLSDYNLGGFDYTYSSLTKEGNTYKPKIRYTVIWLNGDGLPLKTENYLEGESAPTPPTDIPTKAADANGWEYVFTEWDSGTTEGSVTTYRPQFKHTVRWLDESNAELSVQDYLYGASSDSITPPTLSDKTVDGRVYKFTEWKEITITGSVKTYSNPQFVHTVKWLNGDNSELDTKPYLYSDTSEPTTDQTPTNMTDTDGRVYTFTTWNNKTISGSVTTYSNPLFAHTVRWFDDNNVKLDEQTYLYGETEPNITVAPPTKPEDDDYWEYVTSWNKHLDETDHSVTICTPVFTGTDRKYIAQFIAKKHDGSEQTLDEYAYREGNSISYPVVSDYRDEQFVYSHGAWILDTTYGEYRPIYYVQFTQNGYRNAYVAQWLNFSGGVIYQRHIENTDGYDLQTDETSATSALGSGYESVSWTCVSDVFYESFTAGDKEYTNIYVRTYAPGGGGTP